MGVTHHNALGITRTITCGGTLTVSGAFSLAGAVYGTGVDTLNVSGTTVISGKVQATAAGKTHSFTRLYSAGTLQASGNVIATGTGKTLSATQISVSGTTLLSGNVRVVSAANSACGLKTLGTAGTGVVATTKVRSSSRIHLTPIGIAQRGLSTWVSTISSGTNFTVKLTRIQTSGTVVGHTGRVAWTILNQ